MGLVSQVSLFVQDGRESWDLYDCFLTQAEIQGNINHINGKREMGQEGFGVLLGVALSPEALWPCLGQPLFQGMIQGKKQHVLFYGYVSREVSPSREFCLNGDL